MFKTPLFTYDSAEGLSLRRNCATTSSSEPEPPVRGVVGVLGMGVPRHACLRPTAWLCERAHMTHLHQQTFKTLTRGQAS